MSYGDTTEFLGTPVPVDGDVSSGAQEALRSKPPDRLLEILAKALTDDNGDGTLADGFQVSDAGGLDISVSAGQGLIGGLPIKATGATSKTGLTDNNTVYIFLKKTATTLSDRSFTVEQGLSSTMADAILIATVTTAAGDITDVNNTPTGRVPYLRSNPNPQVINDIPGLKVVAPSGGNYTSPKTAIEAASAGDIILICAGSYNLTATITVAVDNLTIIGTNPYACILNNTTGSAQTILSGGGRSGLRLYRLTLQSAAGNNGDLIVLTGCSNVLMRDVVIAGNAPARALYGASVGKLTVQDCDISGAYSGYMLYLYGTGPFIIINSKITQTGAGSCTYLRGAPVILANNRWTASGASYAGVVINTLSCPQLLIERNTITISSPGSCYGMALRNFDAGTAYLGRVVNNALLSSGASGVGIQVSSDAGQYYDEGLIAGNICLLFGVGIRLFDARVRETLVHGNKVATCTTGVSDSGTNTNSQDQD